MAAKPIERLVECVGGPAHGQRVRTMGCRWLELPTPVPPSVPQMDGRLLDRLRYEQIGDLAFFVERI